jgi:hypothetical protein
VKHKKILDVEFRFPHLKGEYYDPREQICYLFWTEELTDSEDVFFEYVFASLIHAELHFRIQEIEGITRSRQFDDVACKVMKWNKEVYDALY